MARSGAPWVKRTLPAHSSIVWTLPYSCAHAQDELALGFVHEALLKHPACRFNQASLTTAAGQNVGDAVRFSDKE